MSTGIPIPSLYRNYLKLVRCLPHETLRSFFRIKAQDDFRVIVKTPQVHLRQRKLKRISRDMRKLKDACAGDTKSFDHVLDVVYGRKGRLKWEIMEPLLTDPRAPVPQPIIPAVPKSRPPIFSRELTALLTAVYSRTTMKALSSKAIACPPPLPARVDPTSNEARLWGPLSKRREVNKRWRYFVSEWKKVYPPLEVVVRESSGSTSADVEVVSHANIREVGLQGKGVFEEIERMVGRIDEEEEDMDQEVNRRPRHTSRWLRRRYQSLLGRLPALIYNSRNGKYQVELSPLGLTQHLRGTTFRRPELSGDDLEWFSQAQAEQPPQKR